jgi:hypothetical protein
MTTSPLDLDEQIAAAQRRIEEHKQRMLADAKLLKRAARRELTSPAALLLAAGVGFALGRITESAQAPGQSRSARIWMSTSGGVKAALRVVRTPGLVWLARWLGTERAGPDIAGPDADRHRPTE